MKIKFSIEIFPFKKNKYNFIKNKLNKIIISSFKLGYIYIYITFNIKYIKNTLMQTIIINKYNNKCIPHIPYCYDKKDINKLSRILIRNNIKKILTLKGDNNNNNNNNIINLNNKINKGMAGYPEFNNKINNIESEKKKIKNKIIINNIKFIITQMNINYHSIYNYIKLIKTISNSINIIIGIIIFNNYKTIIYFFKTVIYNIQKIYLLKINSYYNNNNIINYFNNNIINIIKKLIFKKISLIHIYSFNNIKIIKTIKKKIKYLC